MEINKVLMNRYRIIEKIGEGGTAIVYQAYDLDNEMEVALKVLKEELISPQKIRHFKREAQAIRKMNHPNIIKVYDFGDDGANFHYISQEYVSGMTLKDYIKISSKVSVKEVINITRQVLTGLQHAHEMGIIHKDIKSQNILVDDEKNIKITDFGIADMVLDDVTRTQSLMGTPQYVAPETLNRNAATVQTDIYSVGIMMYELLIGSAPFTGEKASIVMLKQLNQPLPSITMQRKDVPQFLENIIIKASAKKLENRYYSTTEMLVDVNSIFSEKNLYVDKLELENDFFTDGELEKTINFNEMLSYDKLKKEQQQLKKQRKRKWIIFGGLFAIITILLALLYFTREDAIVIPDVTGQNYEEAIASLQLLNIPEENIQVEYVTDNEIEKDVVKETTPPAGEELQEDQKITLTVSSGNEQILITDYTGEIYTEIENDLEDKGLKVKVKEEESYESAGVIIDQSLEPDEEVDYGTELTLTISSGLSAIEMPNLTGLTEAEVDNWVSDNELKSMKEYECSDTVDKGNVISQSPSFNTDIYPGGEIEVKISSGSCPVEEEEEEEEPTEEEPVNVPEVDNTQENPDDTTSEPTETPSEETSQVEPTNTDTN